MSLFGRILFGFCERIRNRSAGTFSTGQDSFVRLQHLLSWKTGGPAPSSGKVFWRDVLGNPPNGWEQEEALVDSCLELCGL